MESRYDQVQDSRTFILRAIYQVVGTYIYYMYRYFKVSDPRLGSLVAACR